MFIYRVELLNQKHFEFGEKQCVMVVPNITQDYAGRLYTLCLPSVK